MTRKVNKFSPQKMPQIQIANKKETFSQFPTEKKIENYSFEFDKVVMRKKYYKKTFHENFL